MQHILCIWPTLFLFVRKIFVFTYFIIFKKFCRILNNTRETETKNRAGFVRIFNYYFFNWVQSWNCHYITKKWLALDTAFWWNGYRMCLVTPSCENISQRGPKLVLQRDPPLMWIPALEHCTGHFPWYTFFFHFWKYVKEQYISPGVMKHGVLVKKKRTAAELLISQCLGGVHPQNIWSISPWCKLSFLALYLTRLSSAVKLQVKILAGMPSYPAWLRFVFYFL